MLLSVIVRTAILVIAVVLALTAGAGQPNLEDFNVLLVPVFSFGPGAYGSQWESSITISSTAREPVRMAVPLLTDPRGSCGPPVGSIATDAIQGICSGYASPSGLLLYIPKTLDLRDLHINARARDLSRQASSAGTDIRVVKESDLRSGDLLLLDIPSDRRFRANLRIYGGMETVSEDSRRVHPGGPHADVLVQIHDSRDLRNPLVSTNVQLSEPQSVDGSPYLTRPAYVSIGDVVAAFPQLADVPQYTIRVRPLQTLADPPRTRTAWAFVSITNNDTQEVTTVIP